MGFLDKIMFWKKKDDFDLDNLSSKEFPAPKDDLGLDQKPPGLEEKSAFDEPTTPYPQQRTQAPPVSTAPESEMKDIELVNSKLDTIKALLNSLDQRLANVERSMGTEQQQRRRLW